VEDPAVAVAFELLEGGLFLAVFDDDIIVGVGRRVGVDNDNLPLTGITQKRFPVHIQGVDQFDHDG
jgi:hypothetical protein